MAMSGINMPLAATGQEIVWHKLWRHYNVSEIGLSNYFTCPALAWNRKSNMRGFEGPLSEIWLVDLYMLQTQILGRNRISATLLYL